MKPRGEVRQMQPDVIVVGAGVAGLTCAGELVRAGAKVLVLDRARGVGGRCATRHVGGQPFDFGVVFLHGADPGFVAALEAVEGATVLRDWPLRRHGGGMPCQPDAFDPGEQRLAWAEGVNVFPRQLARGLDVRLEAEVTRVHATGDVELRSGEMPRAATVVLALAPEQSRALVGPLAPLSTELRAVEEMLTLFASVACVSLIAAYPLDAPEPPWDVSYPDEGGVLQVISNESAKRRERRYNGLVYQAAPRWSRAHLEAPAASCEREILAEAGRLLGPWAAHPSLTSLHPWRYARLDRGNELTAPVLVPLEGPARLGLAGEIFAPGGGVEAAWSSGRALAGRITRESH